jgi:hypothetical protein
MRSGFWRLFAVSSELRNRLRRRNYPSSGEGRGRRRATEGSLSSNAFLSLGMLFREPISPNLLHPRTSFPAWGQPRLSRQVSGLSCRWAAILIPESHSHVQGSSFPRMPSLAFAKLHPWPMSKSRRSYLRFAYNRIGRLAECRCLLARTHICLRI